MNNFKQPKKTTKKKRTVILAVSCLHCNHDQQFKGSQRLADDVEKFNLPMMCSNCKKMFPIWSGYNNYRMGGGRFYSGINQIIAGTNTIFYDSSTNSSEDV